MESKIHKCGESLLVNVPAELLSRLGWGIGDVLNIEMAESGLRIERKMSAYDHAMKIAHDCMDEHRERFEALAKS